jgi:hypothetical protein
MQGLQEYFWTICHEHIVCANLDSHGISDLCTLEYRVTSHNNKRGLGAKLSRENIPY